MAYEFKEMTKAEIRELAEDLVQKFNEANQSDDIAKARELEKEIAEVIDAYTEKARAEVFAYLKASEDPMLEAVKMLRFMTIRTKDTKVEDSDIKVRTIEDREIAINLLRLHKEVKGGIGADKQWIYRNEKLNFLLTAQRAIDLGINPKEINDSYAMNDISRALDMGKTPTSKTNILKTVQGLVSAMIGEEYKATSHDVNFLLAIYSRKDRTALTVKAPDHKYLASYMAEICHRIVTGKTYNILYKKTK